ncbi:hypothetical protein NDI54_05860 [Haloarcula sp. S1AR25-5A]|uniref:Uncharacterized protein n=1 Tax=Haloarcula terrestris TaxID=2950533 RepID=A0AAE4JHY4_9EURY|nr:hypothetical protein [Haloarcula terrestris]MDS0220879.1 hypothetical protein [Haloarcula terrestris]
MSLKEPTLTIAPPQDHWETVDHLRDMFQGAYPYGNVVAFHGLRLECQDGDIGPGVWEVYTAECAYVETLNLAAFRTATELHDVLLDIVACDPDDREDWVAWSR